MGLRKKILVVEDDTDLRDMLGEMIEDAGFSAIKVSGHKEAKRAMEDNIPDLVLLDLMLPDGDGLELCREAAGNDRPGCSPVIFILSGKNSIECKLKSFICGAKRFFTKPFDTDELVDAIRASLTTPNAPLPISGG